jgi:hypothetical protein
MDSTLLYFILFLCCLWLIIDEFGGNKNIDKFILRVFPNLEQTEQGFFSKLFNKD